ncbi:MAG: hypothetical protein JW749_08365 [Sedimentisphaerales bacterium]|nr:hypothetical protein [Sedimentisphaerales bacterium]
MSDFSKLLTNILGRPVNVACDLIESLLGKPFDIAGDMLADQVKKWQWQNRVRIAERADKMLRERKISKRILPPDFFLPLIRECGDVSDDTLQETWARLLCEAIDNDTAQHIGFIHTLKEMSPIDIKVLNALIESGPLKVKERCAELAKRTGLPINMIKISIGNIERLGFFTPTGKRLKSFAIYFLRACLADTTKLDLYIELQKDIKHDIVMD